MRALLSPRANYARWVYGWKNRSQSQASSLSFLSIISRFLSGPVATDVLHVGKSLDAEPRTLAPEAGLLHTAEGDRRAGHLGAVHRHHAELQRPAPAVDARGIARVPIGDEAVTGVVGAPGPRGPGAEVRPRGHPPAGSLTPTPLPL